MNLWLALLVFVVLAPAALWAIYRFLPLNEENPDPWP